jgi:rhamnose transport system permease protein
MISFLKRREVTLIGLILLLFVAVSLRAPGFASLSNINDIFNDTALLIMMGLAQYLIILTGGIDLSVASIMALSGMCAAMVNKLDPSMPIPLVVLIALGAGLALGAFNGTLVGMAGISSIIATLGTISIYRGGVFLLSGGQWISAHQMTEGFKLIPDFKLLGMAAIIWYMILVVILFSVFMNLTKTGREIYALGGNKTAARYVGIQDKKINLLVFSLSGLVSGFCGLLYVARYAAAQNDTATGFELNTVAACVIGGVSIAGGSGTVSGVVLGAIFLGIITNALTVINLSPFFQMAIQGFVILAAIVTNTVMAQRAQKQALARRIF